jgi:hypothetical protein
MGEFVTAAGQYGPWVAMALMLIYIGANKLGPQWLAAWFDERKGARAAEENVYERFIAQQAETLKFIASATATIQGLGRAVDSNTQQMYRLTDAASEGGHCPLRIVRL